MIYEILTIIPAKFADTEIDGIAERVAKMLENDGLKDIGCVFGFVGCQLQYFVKFLHLDELNGVFFMLEELADGFAADAIGLVLEAVDFDTMIHHSLRLLE